MSDKPRRYVVVKHSYYLVEDVPAEWDEESQRFYFEENHCADNEARTIGLIASVGRGYCATCVSHHAEVQASFASLAEAQAWSNDDVSGPLPIDAQARLKELLDERLLTQEQYLEEMVQLRELEDLL